MKKRIISIGLLLCFCATSCKDYLDVSANAGITSEEIYTSYSNMCSFLESVYSGDKLALSTKMYNLDIVASFPLEMASTPSQFNLDQVTDLYTGNRSGHASKFIKGSWAKSFGYLYNDATNNNKSPVFKASFNVIRSCTAVIDNAYLIMDAPSRAAVEELKGEAYFCRAYAHFCVGRLWGPMPYITDLMTSENWDRPRLSAPDFYQAIADDLDRARESFEKAGMMRRDPMPGVAGNLSDPKQSRPNGVAAVALKSRALLYKASPLNNPEGNQQYWIDAADAAAEALNVAEQYGYKLQDWNNYELNFCGAFYTNENLWSHAMVSGWRPRKYSQWGCRNALGDAMTVDGSTGTFPTQNLVDMYDTADGLPLVTAEDRAYAVSRGSYSDQDPYANRDPRLKNNIYYNQADLTWGEAYCAKGEQKNKFNSYYTVDESGARVYSTFAKGFGGDIGDSQTGYIQRKRFNNYHKANSATLPDIPEVLIRLGEIYLNYAEAVNEAYGPNGKSPSGTLTALEAMNVIRDRVSPRLHIEAGTPTVIDKTAFRNRIQKERTVELDQEANHRYYDIRRWKIAKEAMLTPKYGMLIKMVDGDTSKPYRDRFVHTRVELSSTWQCAWQDYMYYWPFASDDYFKYKVFDTSLNPYW